jgi:3-carboxy-cis,cis-muconate cycloisomerase
MSQAEVGEVAEPHEAGRGGSSTMPHKRNPVAALTGIAGALRAPQRVACLLAATVQEHERGLGSWQAELAEWPELAIGVHGAVQAMATALEGLQVFPERMRANIDATHGLVFAEAAAALLTDALPPGAGAALVRELTEEIGRTKGKPPSLQALLTKAVTRRAALRDRVDAAQVHAIFDIEPIAARLALRARKALRAIDVRGSEGQAEGQTDAGEAAAGAAAPRVAAKESRRRTRVRPLASQA